MTSGIPQDPAAGTYRRAPHVAAVVTACALFPLLFVGAGVTSKDAGMAYPDWPTSSGHFINPPNWWQGDHTRWEHGHRLIGWTVGMLAICSAALCWRAGGVVRGLGIGCLAAIILQGVMGGLRVTLTSPALAMLHGIWGQVTFCIACSMALTTSAAWNASTDRCRLQAARFLQRLCVAGVVALLIQLALGAGLRHFDCPYALVMHLLWAVIVAMLIGWIAMWLIGSLGRGQLAGQFGRIYAILMVLQLFLGGTTLIVTVMGATRSPLMRWAAPTAHVAVGALLLACSVLTVLAAYRTIQPIEEHLPAIPAVPVTPS